MGRFVAVIEELHIHYARSAARDVQRHDADRHVAIAHFGKAGRPHVCCKLGRIGELPDRLREVRIRIRRAGDESSDPRQNPARVEVVESPEQSVGRGAEFEDRSGTSRLQYPPKLRKPATVAGEVTEAERNSHEVERNVGQWKLESVRFEYLRAVSAGGNLLASHQQHVVREVTAVDGASRGLL